MDTIGTNPPTTKLPKHTTLSRVRWVTLGYQYDWTARKYYEDAFVPFPAELAAFCSHIGELLGEWVDVWAGR